MKLRSDFVSNSSSSSFIFEGGSWIDFFSVTKDDIVKAFLDLSGGKLRHGENFWVYDLENRKDKKAATEKWGGLLSGWKSNRLVFPKGCKPRYDEMAIASFENLCENLRECYDLSYGFENNLERAEMFVRGAKKGSYKTPNGAYVPIPDYLKRVVAEAKKKIGIVSNLDVLNWKGSRFFMHFDDNEVFCIDGVGAEGAEWLEEFKAKPKKDTTAYERKMALEAEKYGFATEAYSMQRVAEILYRHFAEKGKIRPKSRRFLAEWYGLDKKFRAKGRQYDTYDGKTFGHEDLFDSVLTYNTHEG